MNPIDNTNYELWLLRYAEGDLSAAECAAVEAWLESHPEAAEELALYREAPRLEKDRSVPAYGGNLGNQSNLRPLWPAFLRWSAAAAVVAALMVPALRMDGMLPKEKEPVLVAENRMSVPPVPTTHTLSLPENSTSTVKSNPTAIETIEIIKDIEPMESIKSIDSINSMESIKAPVLIEVSSLIAYEEEAVPADTLHSPSLIAYEPDDWGDRLLALNDATHETLSHSLVGRFVSRRLPDNRQLEERVVEPLRERMDNLKNKLKQ